jgi:predicted MFS family arabinose efflux permease
MHRLRLSANFFAAFLLIAISMGPAVMIAVERKDIAASFGAPEWLISLLYALYFFGAGFGGLLLDRLIRRCGPRAVLFLGATGNMVGGIAGHYAASFELFAASFVLLSFCAAPFLTWLVPLSSAWLPRFPALSLAGVTVGQLVAFWPWQWVLLWAGAADHWRGGLLALAVGGGIQVALVLMLSLSIAGTHAPHAPQAKPSLEVWPFTINIFLVVCGSTILLLNLRPLELRNGMTGSVGLFGAFSAAALIGRFLFAGLCDAGHERASLVAAFTLMALGFATFWCAGASPALSFAGAALLGCGYAGYLPVLIANVRLSCLGSPQRNAKALLVWGNLGIALGAFISGRLAEARAISSGVDIALLICGLAAASLALGFRR